jgi:hypothetical protein
MMANGLAYIQPLSPTDPGFGVPGGPTDPGYGIPDWGPADPGFGNRPPVDPGYGRPGWSPADPGYGQGHPRPPHVGHPLPVPPPAGVVTPPIVLPERPQLPAGSGIVVPLPEGVAVPTPTTPVPPGSKPFILWYGPGTKSVLVHLPPSTPEAQPK